MQASQDIEAQVRQKMQQLQIEGFSSMGSFTPKDHLSHLEEIERIIAGRKIESGANCEVNEKES